MFILPEKIVLFNPPLLLNIPTVEIFISRKIKKKYNTFNIDTFITK